MNMQNLSKHSKNCSAFLIWLDQILLHLVHVLKAIQTISLRFIWGAQNVLKTKRSFLQYLLWLWFYRYCLTILFHIDSLLLSCSNSFQEVCSELICKYLHNCVENRIEYLSSIEATQIESISGATLSSIRFDELVLELHLLFGWDCSILHFLGFSSVFFDCFEEWKSVPISFNNSVCTFHQLWSGLEIS